MGLRTMYRQHLATIDSLPMELLYLIFEYLDRSSIVAWMRTCKRWQPLGERLLYRSPIISSERALESFVKAITSSRRLHLQEHVKELHLRGKVDYCSPLQTPWILTVPQLLVPLLPNIHSLTVEHLEGVVFNDSFFKALRGFKQVSELTITGCGFLSERDVWDTVFSFPGLVSVSLSHSSWKVEKSVMPVPQAWTRMLPLRSIRLGFLSSSAQYVNAYNRLRWPATLRHLELLHYPPEIIQQAGMYLKNLTTAGASLDSFVIGPTFRQEPYDRSPPSDKGWEFQRLIGTPLRQHVRLTKIELHIPDMHYTSMYWVPRLLTSLRELPINHVALEFTLDVHNATKLLPAWELTSNVLSTHWTKTLRRVTLTHNPVGHFVSDALAVHALRERLSVLESRGILDIFIGERYE